MITSKIVHPSHSKSYSDSRAADIVAWFYCSHHSTILRQGRCGLHTHKVSLSRGKSYGEKVFNTSMAVLSIDERRLIKGMFGSDLPLLWIALDILLSDYNTVEELDARDVVELIEGLGGVRQIALEAIA